MASQKDLLRSVDRDILRRDVKTLRLMVEERDAQITALNETVVMQNRLLIEAKELLLLGYDIADNYQVLLLKTAKFLTKCNVSKG
jgi:hypothetical protein